jgi:putative ABC transport system ATP-binding protein
MWQWAWKSLMGQRAGSLGGACGIAAAFVLVIFFDAVWKGESEQIVAYPREMDADVWVMQKGVSNLDSRNGQEVMMILHDVVRDEGRSVVFVTHDPRVEDIADRVLWLEDGALRDRKAVEHARVIDPVC